MATTLLPFTPFADDIRLWLLALDRTPDAAALERLKSGLSTVFGTWRHKGQDYAAAWLLLEDRLLAVAEPTMAGAPSGCAIDGMLRKVHRLAEELNLALVDPATQVLVRAQDGLRTISKAELGDRLADGTLDASTPVLDLSLFTLGALRSGQLEKPLHSTWIGRKFKVPVPVMN